MPTLRQLLAIKFTGAELEANRLGYLTKHQKQKLKLQFEQLSASTESSRAGLVFVIVLMCLTGIFGFWLYGLFSAVGLLLILTFFAIAASFNSRRRITAFKKMDSDLQKGNVICVTGIPSVEFEDGKPYIEIDGIRFRAREKYAIGYKSNTEYTVYCTLHSHTALSYKKVIKKA